MNVFNWLYWNIPFMQLQGQRINIVGVLWLGVMAFFTYNMLRRIHPFRSERTRWIALFNLISSILIAKFVHQYLDDMFILLEIFSGHDYMISAFNPKWNWTVFWITFTWLFLFSTLIMRYLFKLYQLRGRMRINWTTILSMIYVGAVWFIHLTYFPNDYAVLQGAERVTMFWNTYIPLYLGYGFVYLSLWAKPIEDDAT